MWQDGHCMRAVQVRPLCAPHTCGMYSHLLGWLGLLQQTWLNPLRLLLPVLGPAVPQR